MEALICMEWGFGLAQSSLRIFSRKSAGAHLMIGRAVLHSLGTCGTLTICFGLKTSEKVELHFYIVNNYAVELQLHVSPAHDSKQHMP